MPDGHSAPAVAERPAGRPAAELTLPALAGGAVPDAAPAPLRSKLSGMPAAAPEAAAGLRVHEDGERTRGLALQGARDGALGRLALEAAYTQRGGMPAGPGQTGGVTGVWAGALAVEALERRLSLHAEYALSQHDARSGEEPGEAATGEAGDLRLAWRHEAGAAVAAPRWSVALEQSMAESAFRGFGTRPRAGVRVRRVVGELDWGRLQARLARELQADGLAGTEASRRLLDLSLHYRGASPSRLPFADWLFPAPRYRLDLRRTLVADSAAVPVTATAEAVFGRGGWQWGLWHRREYRSGAAGKAAPPGRERTRLRLALPLAGGLTLRPAVERVSRRPAVGAPTLRYWHGALTAELTVLPRRLRGHLRLHARERQDRSAPRVGGLTGGLDWTLPALPGRRPRIALKLDGGVERRDPPAGDSTRHHYQASAALEVAWGD
ncbi:hypothetical protein DEM34_15370 [Spiribacter halobius]|uniref:Uncharacterized protein n=1 Tax=Sediminicurvatus halobius TaxID=2182432 RepID=A0A2U2MXZ4_9GAMM|nr:hypothetical protein DEM34_15370 [Spiribacter halobius]